MTNQISRRSLIGGSIAAGAALMASPVMATKVPQKWDETVDVLVVGSGFAGLAAAIEAKKAGCNVVVLEKMPAAGGTKITYWYGDDEKKDRRSNIRFIKRYFPQIRIHGIPKMAHAELVIVHPEEFCRYAEKFLAGPAEAAQPVGTQDRRMTR